MKKHERVLSTSVEDMIISMVKDILIASIDGLSGFEQAIESVFPQTEIQRCIVHHIRNSCKFVGWKDRKRFCADMKLVYTTPNEEAGLESLDRFESLWGGKYAKSSFPTDDSLFKLLYLVVMDSSEKWRSIRDWSQMVNQLGVYFGERITKHL